MWNLKSIPKIVHFYWGCNKNLSYLRYLSVYSFKKYNPEWSIYIHYPKFPCKSEPTWGTHEQKASSYTDKDYFSELKDLGVLFIFHDFEDYKFFNDVHEVHKSDLIRWVALSRLGGLWSDIDILYVDSIENLINNTENNSDKDTGLCVYPSGCHSIGFLMSKSNNVFYDILYRISLAVFDKNNYQGIGSTLLNKYFSTCEVLKNKCPEINPFYIDSSSVYSINCEYNNILRLFSENDSFVEIKGLIGYHWYGGHPLTQQFECLLTESNAICFNNFIGKILKRILE